MENCGSGAEIKYANHIQLQWHITLIAMNRVKIIKVSKQMGLNKIKIKDKQIKTTKRDVKSFSFLFTKDKKMGRNIYQLLEKNYFHGCYSFM